MTRKVVSKNLLPLLAITALFLSVSLVNYSNPKFLSNQSTQSVLSESDEIKSDEDEDQKDDKDENKEEEVNNESTSQRSESIRVEEEDDDENEFEIEIENEVDGDTDEDEVDDEVETELEEESETVSSDGTVNKFKLKIKTKTINGKTIVKTAAGEVEVEKDPDDTINQLVDSGIIDEPVSFEAKVNNREKVEFEIQGTDSKKFLGIFNVVIPKTLTVSSETGEVVSTNQNVWSRILSLLSI